MNHNGPVHGDTDFIGLYWNNKNEQVLKVMLNFATLIAHDSRDPMINKMFFLAGDAFCLGEVSTPA